MKSSARVHVSRAMGFIAVMHGGVLPYLQFLGRKYCQPGDGCNA